MHWLENQGAADLAAAGQPRLLMFAIVRHQTQRLLGESICHRTILFSAY